MKPKADFYDTVVGSDDTIDMSEVAKTLSLGMGRNKLFQFLRDKEVLDGKNRPYQRYVDNGCFRLVESSFTTAYGDTHINLKTVVYQRGLDLIRRLVNHERY